jgi:hypothetical protein
MVEQQAHNLKDVGSIPTTVTKPKWCNGNTAASKPAFLGSNPSFGVGFWPKFQIWCCRQIGKAAGLSLLNLRVQAPSTLPRVGIQIGQGRCL